MLDRRSVVKGLAGLPLATILADPALAQTAAAQTRTTRIKTRGGQEVAASVAMPETLPAPGILMIHEWWGLNNQMKAVAVDLARQGYMALAVDLFKGRVADDPAMARQIVAQVNEEEAVDTLASWLQWLKNHEDSTRRTATIGWCFGGGWALRAATVEPVDATVVYYGRVNLPAEQLARLRGPVMGHFGTQDQFINEAMVRAFERAMAEADKPYIVYWYDADHAFANPTGDNFDKEDARLAWRRTLDFLGRNLA